MSTREVIRFESDNIKLGVADSQVSSIRTRNETQTAVRIYQGGSVGVASAVGRTNLDTLTQAARESLVFEVPYPVEPEHDRRLSAEHIGDAHDVASLLALTEEICGRLAVDYPQFVFSHGVEHNRVSWDIRSDAGLDLDYRRVTSRAVFVVKEKGSGNIIDTIVGLEGLDLSPDVAMAAFHRHLDAYSRLMAPRLGRQRVVFPGLSGMSGAALFKLFRTDLVARTYSSGASFFDGKVGDGERYFHPKLNVLEVRDPSDHKVCPFDMEGVVRSPWNLDVIREGQLCALAANKRDAHRFGVPATGTAAGDVASLPMSALGRLAARPTAGRLADLLDGEGALLVWFIAGGDTTRSGDMALPAQVLLALDADGVPRGRVPGGTLRGNLFEVFGRDFVGVSEEKVDALSDDGYLVTHMTL